MGNAPWCIMGDFNSMLFPHDGLGGSSRRNEYMEDFFMCLEDIEAFDIRYTGIQFTWCQKPNEPNGVNTKLDRILGNTLLSSRLHDISTCFLPRGVSDHTTGILSFKGGKWPKVRGFRFEDFIADHPGFLRIVQVTWSKPYYSSFMHQLTSKLKDLKKPLRKLWSSYGNISLRVVSLREELNVILEDVDADMYNSELRE